MELIVARHGNTFAPGQPVVWVGSRNDLPLVASGEAQAVRLGRSLLAANLLPTAVYTGPLLRMTAYAQILLSTMQLSLQPTIDQRLNEIDYGLWSGLTTDDVRLQFGEVALLGWEKQSLWPDGCGWGESAELVKARIRAFADELVARHVDEARVLVVASNGCLRFFLDLVPGLLQRSIETEAAKMRTGCMGRFIYTHGEWGLDCWNTVPAE